MSLFDSYACVPSYRLSNRTSRNSNPHSVTRRNSATCSDHYARCHIRLLSHRNNFSCRTDKKSQPDLRKCLFRRGGNWIPDPAIRRPEKGNVRRCTLSGSFLINYHIWAVRMPMKSDVLFCISETRAQTGTYYRWLGRLSTLLGGKGSFLARRESHRQKSFTGSAVQDKSIFLRRGRRVIPI